MGVGGPKFSEVNEAHFTALLQPRCRF